MGQEQIIRIPGCRDIRLKEYGAIWIGGCRVFAYVSTEEALKFLARLGMSEARPGWFFDPDGWLTPQNGVPEFALSEKELFCVLSQEPFPFCFPLAVCRSFCLKKHECCQIPPALGLEEAEAIYGLRPESLAISSSIVEDNYWVQIVQDPLTGYCYFYDLDQCSCALPSDLMPKSCKWCYCDWEQHILNPATLVQVIRYLIYPATRAQFRQLVMQQGS